MKLHLVILSLIYVTGHNHNLKMSDLTLKKSGSAGSGSSRGFPPFSNDLGNWMSNLPPQLKKVPFIQLAIPGTHNSMSFGMSGRSNISPDAASWLLKLRFLGWPLRVVICRWSTTQSADTTSQLEHGIRYLDLRVATREQTNELFFCHGLYTGTVREGFKDINDFLDKHPGELVILDLQHFYEFRSEDHQKLLQLIEDVFGKKVFKFSYNVDAFTLEFLTEHNSYQVICIYRSPEGHPVHWPSDYFPTPWPETTSIPQLLATLNHGLNRRQFNKGFVSQCVLTPDSTFIVKNPFSTLRSACAARLQKPMLQWISEQSPGKGKLNVTISDFADMNDWIYTKNVINLNSKLQ